MIEFGSKPINLTWKKKMEVPFRTPQIIMPAVVITFLTSMED